MKKLFLILLVLVSAYSFAQRPKGTDIEVAKADTAFGRTIPIGFYVWEVDSGKIYRINTKMYASTDSMATVFRDGNYDVFGGAGDQDISGIATNTQAIKDTASQIRSGIPTNNNQLANGAGYATNSQVGDTASQLRSEFPDITGLLPKSAFGDSLANHYLIELDSAGFRIATGQIVGYSEAGAEVDPIALDSINSNIRPFIAVNRDSINTFSSLIRDNIDSITTISPRSLLNLDSVYVFSPLIRANQAKITFPGFTSLITDYGFTDNSSNWNTAYTDRLKWDGGATGLNATTAKTSLGLVIGTNVQAYDADLTTYAGITPSANVQTLLGSADYSAFKTSLSLNNVENTALSTYTGSGGALDNQYITNGAGYISSQTDDQTASEVPFTPNGSIASTDVQAAIQEVRDEAGGISYSAPQILTITSGNSTMDLSTSTNATVTLTSNDTITFTNVSDGMFGAIRAVQNGTGGYGVHFIVSGKAINYNPGVPPTAANINSGATDVTTFSYQILGDTVEVGFNAVQPDYLPLTAEINAQTGTSYTLLSSDNGKIVTLNNGSAITVTVPSGLGTGFNCTLIQLGAGQVSVSESSTTINNRNSHTSIAGQYGSATLLSYATDTFLFQGDTE